MMTLTVAQLQLGFERIESAQMCRNLMGMFAVYHTETRHNDLVELWADREDDVLYMPWGAYYGKQGVKTCFVDELGDRSDPRVQSSPIMKGALNMHPLDTCVLEVAGDNQTARGCWMSPGINTAIDPAEGKPVAEWNYSKLAVDFLREDGMWKIWKLHLYPLFRAGYDICWTEYRHSVMDQFPHPGASPLPRQNWQLARDTVYPVDQPVVPRPYATYGDLPEFQ